MFIGILGKKRSGKDTIADYLSKYGYQKDAMANPLKEVSRIMFDFNDQQLYGDQKEVKDEFWNITPREVLQFLGTEIVQYKFQELLPGIGRKFWVKLFLKKYQGKKVKIVVSDIRFQHEVDLIHSLGGKVIKLERPDLKTNDEHASEIELDSVKNHDYTIKNNGTIDELYHKVDLIIESENNSEI